MAPEIKVRGKKAEVIEVDGETAWAFFTSETHFLLLSWEVDHNGYGHWRLKLGGIEDGKPVVKEFGPGKKVPAFYGEVKVNGVGTNELWSSYGFEDPDVKDAEGNVMNKPRDVRLYPKRED